MSGGGSTRSVGVWCVLPYAGERCTTVSIRSVGLRVGDRSAVTLNWFQMGGKRAPRTGDPDPFRARIELRVSDGLIVYRVLEKELLLHFVAVRSLVVVVVIVVVVVCLGCGRTVYWRLVACLCYCCSARKQSIQRSRDLLVPQKSGRRRNSINWRIRVGKTRQTSRSLRPPRDVRCTTDKHNRDLVLRHCTRSRDGRAGRSENSQPAEFFLEMKLKLKLKLKIDSDALFLAEPQAMDD